MTIQVAVWGLGSIGLRHARNLLALGVDVAGHDLDVERRALLDAAGGQAFEQRKHTIDGSVAVVIATPSQTHLQDLDGALSAGLPAFVEKPIAHDAEALATILDAAEAKQLAVFAGLNMRFHPAVQAAHDVISMGRLGRPVWGRLLAASYLPDWRPHQDYRDNYAADPKTGGAIFDFIHEFDLAHYLLGKAEVVGASARRSGQLDMESEDVADVILRHPQGVVSNVHVDYVTRPRQRRIEIGLEQGVMTLDLENAHLAVWDVNGEQTLDQQFVYDPNDMYLAEMKAFLDTIEAGVPPVCPGREALAVLRTVIATRRLCGLPET